MKIIVFSLLLFCFFIYPAFGEQFPITIPEGAGTPGCDSTTSCFVPYDLSIDEGDTVTWSNDDSVTHTVTRGGSGSFNSDLLVAGDEFSFTFDQLGQFPYHCTLHPWMWGIIIVGDVVDTTDNIDDSYGQSIPKNDFSILSTTFESPRYPVSIAHYFENFIRKIKTAILLLEKVFCEFLKRSLAH